MNITTLERLTTIWKSLKPKSYNVFTRIIILSGLGVLTVPSVIQVLSLYLFGKEFYFTIFGKNDIYTGLFLVIIGLIYNVKSQWIEKQTEPKNSIENSSFNNSKVVQVQGNYYVGASSEEFQEIKDILKNNSPLKDEWFKQIHIYKDLLNEYKPKTALQLVEALEMRLSESDLSTNHILKSEIAYLKGLCLEMIKDRVKDAYKCFILAYELNSGKEILKERACIAYYMSEEYNKAQIVVNDILSDNSLDAYANAINILLKPESIPAGIDSVSKIVSSDQDFNRIIYLNIRNKSNSKSLIGLYPKLIQNGAELTLLDSTHSNYKYNQYIIEIAISRFLREYKILFHTIDYDNNEVLASTHKILNDFMKLLQNSEIKENYIQIDFFRVYTGYLISKDDSAVFELQKIFDQQKESDELLGLILSNVLQQSNKVNEAIQVLKGLNQDNPSNINLLLYCYYRVNDVESYVAIANKRIQLLEKIDSSVTEELLRIIGFFGVHDRANEVNLECLFDKQIEISQYLEFIKMYRDLFVSGPKEKYNEWLIKNKEILLSSEINISHYIQDAFFMNKNFKECIAVIELGGDKLSSPFEISNYIWSLYNVKASNQKLLKWLNYWRCHFPYNSTFSKLEIQKRAFISDWKECLNICKYTISNEEDEYFMLYLAISCFNLNSIEEFANYTEELSKFNYQNEMIALQIANLLIHFKYYEKGIELCYNWAIEKENKQARTMFFMSFMQLPRDDFFVTFDEIKQDCYVFYQIIGKDRNYIKRIENDEFSAQLLGHKTGDVIQVKRQFGNTVDSYKIGAICNKYSALKFEIMNDTDNPQSGLGMQSFMIGEDGSLLDIINQIAGPPDANQPDFFKEYYSQKIKFSQLAFCVPELRDNLIHTYFKLIYEKNGLLKMDPKAFTPLDFFLEYDFILDFTSLLHFYLLEKEGQFTFRIKFKIPSFILVLINSYQNETLGMVNHKEYVLDKAFYDQLIVWINEKCDIISPISLLDLMDGAIAEEKIDNNLSHYLMNQVAMIQEFPNSVLITDDLFFYEIYPLSQKKLISTDVFLVYEMLMNTLINKAQSNDQSNN